METFLPPEGITSLIWKGDTVLLIMHTSSSGEDCIRFFVGVGKEIFECMELIVIPQLLLIAGTGRNTGKTTFACQILRKFSQVKSIYSVKITPHFHKNIQSGKVILETNNLYIAEETDSSTTKDSSLMLGSGAQKSFFVMATDENLMEAFQKIIQMIPSGSFIVCESGGLRHHVVPGLFFMMNKTEVEKIKPDAEKLKLLADRVITFDGEKTDFELNSIEINDNRWKIKDML